MDNPTNPFGSLQVLVITLPPNRLARLQSCEGLDFHNSKDADVIFREPVPEFEHSRSQTLVCFIHDGNKVLTHLAVGRRGYSAGTELSQVEFTCVERINSPLPLVNIQRRIDGRFSNRVAEVFKIGGLLPLKTSHAVLEELLKQYPAAQNIIQRAFRAEANPVQALDAEKQFFFQQQQDSVLMSLQMAGLDRKEHLHVDFVLDQPPKSFLEGLPQARLREGAMLTNDFQHFPGFKVLKPLVQNAAIFSDGKTLLSVMLVHEQPLEGLIGTDLIYYNETFKSFAMVQYKAMEKEGNEHIFRIPNAGLDDEITKMQAFLEELALIPPNDEAGPHGFRLHTSPFFLKFCPREVRRPDDIELVPGMYLPLEYWTKLKDSLLLVGKNKGKGLRFDNCARYLTNTEFTTIVSKAWIGTRVEESMILEKLIQHTLQTGRAVTLARARALPSEKEPGSE